MTNYDSMERAVKLGDVIIDRLRDFGCQCDIDIDDGVILGPRTIRYELILGPNTRVREITKYKDDLQYELGVKSVRILAPVPGKRNVGIETERPDPEFVSLSDFTADSDAPLTYPLGITPEGEQIYLDLIRQPHLLVAGQTGSGKSSGLHAMLCSLIGRFSPEELTLILVDTKMCELTHYEGIPHLATPVVTDAFEVPMIFEGIVNCMEKRYQMLSEYGVKNLSELNEKLIDELPYCLVVVDEIADLMSMNKANIEQSIVRIAQKARAVGIHLVLATQSPRREVISGLLKANVPSRIAFATSSELDSRIVLDASGAGSLLGSGDGLFSEGGKPAIRFQAPFLTNAEITETVENCKNIKIS